MGTGGPLSAPVAVFGGHSAPADAMMDTSGTNNGDAAATGATGGVPPSPAAMRTGGGMSGVRHQTMEFFELCTELITTLAR